MLVNKDIDETEAELINIVSAERLRRERRMDLNEFVRGLDKEFQETR